MILAMQWMLTKNFPLKMNMKKNQMKEVIKDLVSSEFPDKV